MMLHKVGGLHKHAARSTTGIVYTTMIGLDDLDQSANNAGWRVELASVLSLLLGKFRETVLISASEDIAGISLLGHFHIRK